MGLRLDQLCGKLKKSVVSERLLISSVFAGGDLSGSEGKTSSTLPTYKSADKHSSKETCASDSDSKQEVSDSPNIRARQDGEPSGGSTELCGKFELPAIPTNNACQQTLSAALDRWLRQSSEEESWSPLHVNLPAQTV